MPQANNDEGPSNQRPLNQSVHCGLYDPAFEHGSCGTGFVVRLDAEPNHAIVASGVELLINLEHRGAVGGDKATGDGAGLLLQIPHDFFREEAEKIGFTLPRIGDYATGIVFLPKAPNKRQACILAFERATALEGCLLLGWRRVPVEPDTLGEFARNTMPDIRQLFIARGDVPKTVFQQKLYVIRRCVENEIARAFPSSSPADAFYVPSLSATTIAYKGMLVGSQLAPFYPDLRDKRLKSPYALVHQRYSTNTFPSWSLAQPFRYLAHNGEINTLRGNVNRMLARESTLRTEFLGEDIEKVKPVIMEGGSDSAMLDNALELLLMGGRSLPHAMMMMVPEAWGAKFLMGEDKRAFYEYHSAFMEPWDGPAALVFTDGRYIGATLDRNGLRPCRYTITRDGLIIMASETGALDIPPENALSKGRLQPGRMFLVDLQQHRVIPDQEIKATISRRRPYRHWVRDNRIELRGLHMPSEVKALEPETLRRLQHAFGYTQEELNMIINPMAARSQEAVGSMGNDAALAVISRRPQLFFAYFKQLFAQVTNPPIDPLREELVMSLMSFVGRQRNMLVETPEHCRQLKLNHPILTPEDMLRLRNAANPDVVARDIDILFPADGDGKALERALDDVFTQAESRIAEGATLLVLTDLKMSADKSPIPAMLAASGLHHHLTRKGLRGAAGIVVESGEVREVAHFCLLIAYGANAICPYLAFSTARALAEEGLLEAKATPEEAVDSYITAVKKGLLKTFSRMGISTIRSFFGSQIYEAVGLGKPLVDKYLTGTSSRVGGVGLDEIAADTIERHRAAYPRSGVVSPLLPVGGNYKNRHGGEKHLWSAEAIFKLQHAARTGDYAAYKQYAAIIENPDDPVTLRSLFRFRKCEPIPIEEVEPVGKIIPRFVSAAMSFGSISKEAHETIAIGMNRAGGRSNSGEGGEDPQRYPVMPNGDWKCSRVKQIASGRFGVTIEYLVNCDELQIKIAQGAKPGEGGQLPGHKVTDDIARVRHTTPGVTLISPPPHHDIYSIEDIAQLIYDLKCANPRARVSVKLVSEAGVGTIAAGVAKAKADMVLIAGHDGGTGASPWTAIKHCGLPWELGLAETQQTLVRNRLRDRIRVQVDGQLRTGRDLAIAAMLGAEEFGFGSLMLVLMGCVMLRKCHMNTCSVGVATQDPELRKRFAGKPEYVVNFVNFIATDLREHMARLGIRTVDEMVGRCDMLEAMENPAVPKARTLDFRNLLIASALNGEARSCSLSQDHELEKTLDVKLIELARPAIERQERVVIEMPIRNVNRAVGTMLSGEIARRRGLKGLPPDTITLNLKGTAGQSMGAFLSSGISIRIEGEANDYLAKGMSGGRIVLIPPQGTRFEPGENVIAGNVALYGATGGEVYINGIAGERFAIRNGGARAVVEGAGNHGCEYMTGGIVVVLGQTGNNFAAGMTGGIAYIFNDSGLFDIRCNLDTVDLETVWTERDQAELAAMIRAHMNFTGSARAARILENWEACLPMFVKVMPIDYRKSLERMKLHEDTDKETVSATEEVYHG
ncbi:MAG TPA: glutamate synthase large subunit [Candidatus Brocadiia bacterium]|nr:glutamate synthase large subunit [Candidatus Brocadiia bacterium]